MGRRLFSGDGDNTEGDEAAAKVRDGETAEVRTGVATDVFVVHGIEGRAVHIFFLAGLKLRSPLASPPALSSCNSFVNTPLALFGDFLLLLP